MKKRKSTLALIVFFTMIVSFFAVFVVARQETRAAVSLPGIEKIKQSGKSLNIVEIVPTAGSGSIGWYVDGQEPGKNWAQTQLASLNSTAARQAAATAYLSSLASAGLLGDGDTTPLRKAGDYTEYLPWQRGSATGLKTLNLNSPEEYTLAGAFSATGALEYRADNTYAMAPGGAGGDYDLDLTGLARLTEAPGGAESVYIYTPGAFFPIATGANIQDGVLVWQKVAFVLGDDGLMSDHYDLALDSGNNPVSDINETNAPNLTYLVFEGCTGSSYFPDLNLQSRYYGAEFTVGTAYNAGVVQFEPVYDGFVQVASGRGHFSAETQSYTYVGVGSPEATHSYSSTGGGSFTVRTQIVFYTGGFTNNNWLRKYVFDWEQGESAPAVTVSSVTPGSVTAEAVAKADLIVLSAGRGTAGSYVPGSNDISLAVRGAVVAAAQNTPVIVYNSLRGAGGNIGGLAGALATGGGQHYVNQNIYCIDRELAADTFAAPISGDHTVSTDPFYAVWYELNYENFLREQNDPNAVHISETVSVSACVRYIINYGGGRRDTAKKTEIRVLQLQPGKGTELTKQKVKDWTGLDTSKITIDTMSSSEFIGKIDDLAETYDLIYIGASLTGFSTTGSGASLKTSYTDPDMNGLIYANIGDTVTSGYVLSGLLNRDYATSTFKVDGTTYKYIKSAEASRAFRYSGNDITPSKYQELRDFSDAGYPVVVADSLMDGDPGYEGYSFTAKLTAGSDGKSLIATADLTEGIAFPLDAAFTYKWYKSGIPSPLSTNTSTYPSAAYTLAEGTSASGTYYCTITIGDNTVRSNNAAVTASQSYIATEGGGAVAGKYNNSSTYTVSITRANSGGGNNKTYTYTYNGISPTPSPAADIEWQRYNNGQWYYAQSGNSLTISRNSDDYYRLYITINGEAQSINLNTVNNGTSTKSLTFPNYIVFDLNVTWTANSSGVTLTAACSPSVPSPNYAWVRTSGGGGASSGSGNTRTASSGTYYFTARDNARSNSFTISQTTLYSITPAATGATTAQVPGVEPTLWADKATVDSCSYMYQFLDAAAGRNNTFTADSVAGSGKEKERAALQQYLNLSKPEIVFAKDGQGDELIPTPYTGTNSAMTGRTLSYTFTIRNETDVTPAETRYTCNLYLDTDADGRYHDTELLADIRIVDAAGNVITNGQLQAGVQYIVTRTMPNEYVGIIPWQLEVVKVGQTRVHASQRGYTRIAGAPTTIHILQILHKEGGGLNLTTNATYQALFSDVKDFDLDIATVTAQSLNNSGSWTVSRKNAQGQTVNTTYSDREAYLAAFDMVILGFADCYGELNEASAQAVVNFIATGKSILFTHDTTSFINLPSSSYKRVDESTAIYSGNTWWGYYFNTLLRDAVGLDRYGVTSTAYGAATHTKNATNQSGINVAKEALSLTANSGSNAQTMKEAGYSVAYVPVSRTGATPAVSTLAEVQGYTNFTLNRFKSGGSMSTTTTVSQVNEGQITTYPFDLNLKGFGGKTDGGTTMTIATTHDQYYQLNMNADDIVVWYCLAGGNYQDLPNDVVNAYYIYSVGNVTYSGAGHSGDSVSTEEAKLFINTMIAAFQTTSSPPRIQAVDPAAGIEINDKFYIGDEDAVLTASDRSESALYFIITDTSLAAGKKLTVKFTDEDNNELAFPIYVKDGGGTPVNMGTDGTAKSYTLYSGVTYYIYPTERYAGLKDSGQINNVNAFLADFNANSRAELNITVTSSLVPGSPDTATVTLRRIGLFPLD